MALSRAQEEALRLLGNMVVGGAASGIAGRLVPVGRGVWNKGGTRPINVNPSTVGVATELAEKSKSQPIDFDAGIIYIPGDPQMNAGLVRTPDNLESFIRQTPLEHEQALRKFMGNPAIPPDRAARLGIREEERLPKWWNDHDPRLPVTPTSSCVKRARIGSNGDIYVIFGSNPNKEYQYAGSDDPVEASKILQELVTSGSIGRDMNPHREDSWGWRHSYLKGAKG